VQYIWGKLLGAWLSEEDREAHGQVEALLAAVAHRPQHPHTAGHQRFVRATLGRLRALQRQRPALDLAGEERQLLAALLPDQ
jgi:hypothetical protein